LAIPDQEGKNGPQSPLLPGSPASPGKTAPGLPRQLTEVRISNKLASENVNKVLLLEWLSQATGRDMGWDVIAAVDGGLVLCELAYKALPELKGGSKSKTGPPTQFAAGESIVAVCEKIGVKKPGDMVEDMRSKQEAAVITSMLRFLKVLLEKYPKVFPQPNDSLSKLIQGKPN